MIRHVIYILATAFMIAACEGGGGCNSVQTDMQLPTLNDARIVPFEALQMGGPRTATSVPRFTSTGISKSSNTDPISGTTTDTVSVSFHALPGEITDTVSTSIDHADPEVSFTVTREDGSSLVFDSASQSVTDTIQKRPLPPSPIRRHHLRGWSLFDYSESGTSAANVTVSWHNDAPEDYLASGYWMRLKGDLDAESVENVEVGTFIDGPEFSSAPQLPTVGTATYRGRFAGIYTVFYADSHIWQQIDPRLVDGFKESGEVSGEMLLRVDFANKTIEGCTGCVENLETTGVTIDPSGNRSELYTQLSLASVRFAPTQIRQEGSAFQFQDTDVTAFVSEPRLGIRFDLGETQGSWGGKFSDRTAGDGSGDPGLVAGTIGAQFRLTSEGSRGMFVGSFFATKLITQ